MLVKFNKNFSNLIEKRRLERNDPEVTSRHRDVANRLKNNYSSLATSNSNNRLASSSSLTMPSSTSRLNIQSSSLNTTNNNASSHQLNNLEAGAKSALSNVKNFFTSSIPSLFNKGDKKGRFFFLKLFEIIHFTKTSNKILIKK